MTVCHVRKILLTDTTLEHIVVPYNTEPHTSNSSPTVDFSNLNRLAYRGLFMLRENRKGKSRPMRQDFRNYTLLPVPEPAFDVHTEHAFQIDGPVIRSVIDGCLCFRRDYGVDPMTTLNRAVVLAGTADILETPRGTRVRMPHTLGIPSEIDPFFERPLGNRLSTLRLVPFPPLPFG